MDNQEVHRLLQRLPRRGVIFGRVFAIALIIVATLLGVAATVPGPSTFFLSPSIALPWALLAFESAVLSALGSHYSGKRWIDAWTVSEKPQEVYWVHALEPRVDTPIESCRVLSLHLRNGHRFDVYLSRPEMRSFIAWLRKSNVGIRWGYYDTLDHEE